MIDMMTIFGNNKININIIFLALLINLGINVYQDKDVILYQKMNVLQVKHIKSIGIDSQ